MVRLVPGRRDVADKVWAGIGRVAGTITAWDSGRLLVDEGATKRRRAVIIAPGPRTASGSGSRCSNRAASST